jgi:hypothetical protein
MLDAFELESLFCFKLFVWSRLRRLQPERRSERRKRAPSHWQLSHTRSLYFKNERVTTLAGVGNIIMVTVLVG